MTTATQPRPARSPVVEGVWRLADPKISLASFAGMFLGACAAATVGGVAWGWLALTVLGIFCIEVAKNASGEVYDWDSGTDLAIAAEDRSPFSGGKRVMVDGLLTRKQTWAVAGIAYALGAIAGVVIAFERAHAVLWLGVVGAAIAFWYHAPPFRFSYRGLGELAVGVAYGPLICAGTFLVQAGFVPGWMVWVSVPLGLLIAAFLWANEFPDYLADRAARKRTLVVRLGRPRAAVAFTGIVTLAFVIAALLPLLGAPRGTLLGLVAAPLALQAARTLRATPEVTAEVVPAQAKTLLSFLVYAVAAGVGMLLVR
ncbi:MAG TPA: prenyltransferase [Gemmatimonadaceae bacterium]